MDNEEPLNEFSDAEITKILKDALKLKLEEKKKIPTRVQLNRALVSTMGEFLGCYKLMGYDLDGNPVNMTVYNNKLQKSALDNSFIEEFGRFMNKRDFE